MQYRRFGRLDWQVSALGFGLERLPPDETESKKMLRYAIDGGVNFIDAGSEPFLKRHVNSLQKALKDGYRQKVKLSVTLPSAKINKPDDFDRELENLLNLIDLNSIDFLTLGGLDRYSWPKLVELETLQRAEAALKDKRIGYIGFFFHDQYQFLREIIESYDNWTFCQFQYSFMDIDHHPGSSGLTYAADKGLGVIVTRPLKGGRLTKALPEPVAKIWSASEPERRPVEWGLRWVWNHADISSVVVDMSDIEQLKFNLALADKALADSFSVPEELVISRVRDAYRALKPLPCTACRGCMPCTQGVDAPRIFEIYNDAIMYDDKEAALSIYRLERHNIDCCDACGICAEKCGFKFPIPDWLKKAREILVKDK